MLDEWELYHKLNRLEKESEPYEQITRSLSNIMQSNSIDEKSKIELNLLYIKYSTLFGEYDRKIDDIRWKMMDI